MRFSERMVADVAAALAPRPLLIEQFVDGRNRVVPETGLGKRFGLVYQSYREKPSRLTIRSQSQEPRLARWLAEELK